MSYCIGSLNLLRNPKSEEHKRAFYEFFSELIKEEELDILALQEISNIELFSGLLRSLPGWKGFHSDSAYPNGKHKKGSEFAFLWNDRIEYHGDYELKVNVGNMQRTPLFGRFFPKGIGAYTEFRLINIHLVHGGDTNMAYGYRKAECTLVKDKIYKEIDMPGKREGNKVIFTVALGDYNLEVDVCNACKPEHVITIQSKLTTLGDNGEYSKSYDHFSYDKKRHPSVVDDSDDTVVNRVDVEKYFNGKRNRYHELISNHVPVKIKIF